MIGVVGFCSQNYTTSCYFIAEDGIILWWLITEEAQGLTVVFDH